MLMKNAESPTLAELTIAATVNIANQNLYFCTQLKLSDSERQ